MRRASEDRARARPTSRRDAASNGQALRDGAKGRRMGTRMSLGGMTIVRRLRSTISSAI